MADDDADLPRDEDGRAPDEEPRPDAAVSAVTAEGGSAEGTVVRVGGSPAVQWRRRALALRAAVPELARNPVVVGASAAVATVALRVAVYAIERAVGSGSSPRTVAVTGAIRHEVHVVRHVHVVHHLVHHYYPYGPLPYWSRSSPP
jgi:hypothetical protein